MGLHSGARALHLGRSSIIRLFIGSAILAVAPFVPAVHHTGWNEVRLGVGSGGIVHDQVVHRASIYHIVYRARDALHEVRLANQSMVPGQPDAAHRIRQHAIAEYEILLEEDCIPLSGLVCVWCLCFVPVAIFVSVWTGDWTLGRWVILACPFVVAVVWHSTRTCVPQIGRMGYQDYAQPGGALFMSETPATPARVSSVWLLFCASGVCLLARVAFADVVRALFDRQSRRDRRSM